MRFGAGQGIGGGRTSKRLGSVKIVRGRILSVDKTRWTATVVDQFNAITEGVQIGPVYVGAKGQGMFYMPEVNAPVWLCTPSEDTTPFILMGCAFAQNLPDGETDDGPDYRMNRPVLNEGDQMISSQDGNFIVIRRGGVIEIGASQLAQRTYIPGANLLRDLCQSYDLLAAGGRLSWSDNTQERVTVDGVQKTPIEFRLEVKEYAEDETPVLELVMGKVPEGNLAGGDDQVVAKLSVGNNLAFWIDKNGVINSARYGAQVTANNGPTTDYHHEGHLQEIKGLFSRICGRRFSRTLSSVTEEIGGDHTTQIEGNRVLDVQGEVTRTTGAVTEEIRGEHNKTVVGTERSLLSGNKEVTITGSRVAGIGQSDSEVIAGRKTVTIINSELDSAGYALTVANGALQLHNVLGDLEFTCTGTPLLSLTKLKMDNRGSVLAKHVVVGTEVEVNPTGVRMKSPGGEVSIDLLGTVLLGPPGRGGVVTTLTHPACYVTGIPILGSSSVQAGGLPVVLGAEAPSTFLDIDSIIF